MALTKRSVKGSALTNAELDANFTHLGGDGTFPAPSTKGTAGQVLKMNAGATALEFGTDEGTDVVVDTTPQLGGNLDVNGNKIVSASGGDIDIEPDGTGDVLLGNFKFDADATVGAGQDNMVMTYDHSAGKISLEASAGGDLVVDTTPQLGGNLDVQTHSIVSVSNQNIAIAPDGAGKVILDGLNYPTADGNAGEVLKTDGSGNLSFGSAGGGSATAVVANNAGLQALSGNSVGDFAFVTGTNKLYVRNSNGWYLIATVTNATPTISSAGNASYSFALDGTPVVIDVVATDAEGETITYAHTVSSGSLTNGGGVTATVVQGSGAQVNRFTITPTTNSSYAGSFSLTFTAQDPNGNTATSGASSFTLSFATSGSLYFDGTGDFIHHATSSDFTLGTGNFTVEFWVRWGPDLTNNEYLISLGGNALRVSQNSGVINCFGSSTDKLTFTPNAAESTGWHHIALVRNGNDNTVYYDGQSKATATNSSWNHTSNTMVVGQYDNTSTNGGYTWGPGWLSNIRIVKGTAVYTSNFTVPTAPLTAISGTVYLIANNTVPTVVTNGSYYFTSTSSRLTASSTDFDWGSTNPFTMEMWYKMTTIGNPLWDFGVGNTFQLYEYQSKMQIYGLGGGYVIDFGTGVGHDTNVWYHVAITGDGSNNVKAYLDGVQVGSTHTGSWSITGSKIRLNGYAGSGYTNVGHIVYMADVRLVVGTQVYTGNFTKPSGPLTKTGGTYPSNTNVNTSIPAAHTKLLTAQNSSGSHVDNSDSSHTLTQDATVTPSAGVGYDTTDVSSTGHTLNFAGDTAYNYATPFVNGLGGSAYFDGNGDYLSIPSSNLNPGTGDYTLECWYRADNPGNPQEGLVQIANNPTSNTQGGIGIMHSINPGSNKRYAIFGRNATGETQSTGDTTWPTANTWYHVALMRKNSKLTLFENGTPVGGLTNMDSTVNWTTNNEAVVGTHYNTSNGWHKGYISNVRFTHNAVYTPAPAGGLEFTSNGETTLASHAGFDFGTGNWTIEFFYKWKDNSGYKTLLNHEYNSGTVGCTIQSNANTYKWGIFGSGMPVAYESSDALPGRWYHYAFVRNGNTVKIYRDAVETRSFSQTASVGSTNTSMFGHGNTHYDNGMVSNFRVVKGTALYTSAGFTIPTATLTAVSGTELLLFQENSGSTLDDGSTNNVAVTKAAQHDILTIDGAFYKFTAPVNQLSAISGTRLLVANDSNVFNDASSHNHSVTVNGNVYPNKFIPFS